MGHHLMPVLFVLLVSYPLCTRPSEVEAVGVPISAYDALRSHGLPIGLLPKGVREFRVDAEGLFVAELEAACSAHFETEVRYERNVTGALSYGQIASLSGVSAQELFLWLPVRAIRVPDPNSGLIFFDVGGIRKQFSLSLFETPPDCNPISPDHQRPDSVSLKLRQDLDRENAHSATVI